MICGKNEKRTELQSRTTSIISLLEKFDSLWLQFLIHHFYTIYQRAYIKKTTEESSEMNIAVVQLDFAENFTPFYQAAVQSSYWSQKQIPIFRAFVKIGSNHRSLVLLSDYMQHTTEFIYEAQRVIVNFVKN